MYIVQLTNLLFHFSWISLLMPPENIPGRAGLLITLTLVVTNISLNLVQRSPQSSAMNQMFTWVYACSGLVRRRTATPALLANTVVYILQVPLRMAYIHSRVHTCTCVQVVGKADSKAVSLRPCNTVTLSLWTLWRIFLVKKFQKKFGLFRFCF